MADPDFLDRAFTLKFQPANALTRILGETMKFTSCALLTMVGLNKFQIKSDFSDHHAVLSLEMDSYSIFATFDTGVYCLRFSVLDWYNQIKNPITENPSSSMSIKKSPGSAYVHCSFGKDKKMFELGKAEFVKREEVHPYDRYSNVRVAMGRVKFRSFIQSFSSRHENGVSAVQLRITPSSMTWITPRRSFDYSVEKYVKKLVLPGASIQFGVRWDLTKFEMLRSAAFCCDSVELTVFENSDKERFFRFRFLYSAKSYYLSYVEKVPPW